MMWTRWDVTTGCGFPPEAHSSQQRREVGTRLALPTHREKELANSSLRFHLLDKDQGFGIVNRWLEFAKEEAAVDRGGKTLHPLERGIA